MTPENRPHAVILAGGRSTRLGGGDKALLPLGPLSVLDHVILRLRPQVAGLALNANGNAARFASFALPVLKDPVPDHPGPLAGILAAMEWAAGQGHDRVLTVAADTPFLPHDLADRLQKASCSGPALAKTTDPGGAHDWHPTCGIWPVFLRDALRTAIEAGQRKVLSWAMDHQACGVDFDRSPVDPFFNINTLQDLAEARRLMAIP